MRKLELRELGRIGYQEAYSLQKQLVAMRQRDEIPDQLLLLEHPHTITQGRNGHRDNLLVSGTMLERAGIGFHETDRGGDITYHGPGQLVGYPILDLREWKRDVAAYLRGLEQVLIDGVSRFGIEAGRMTGATGVWVGDRKLAAIGVHISRWVTCHGFALNVDTDLSYFRYIVPCGLTKPVTSLRDLGCMATRKQLTAALAAEFSTQFNLEVVEPEPALSAAGF